MVARWKVLSPSRFLSLRRCPSALYERAGFSSPDSDGKMCGGPQGQEGPCSPWPLDMAADIDEQVAKAQAGSAAQCPSPPSTLWMLVQAGVPVYWDDVAETMPEMFTLALVCLS